MRCGDLHGSMVKHQDITQHYVTLCQPSNFQKALSALLYLMDTF